VTGAPQPAVTPRVLLEAQQLGVEADIGTELARFVASRGSSRSCASAAPQQGGSALPRCGSAPRGVRATPRTTCRRGFPRVHGAAEVFEGLRDAGRDRLRDTARGCAACGRRADVASYRSAARRGARYACQARNRAEDSPANRLRRSILALISFVNHRRYSVLINTVYRLQTVVNGRWFEA
jgi:hypothetical protein